MNGVSVIAAIDFLPSLLTIAGSKPPADAKRDGIDLSASLLGKERGIRAEPLFWLRPPDRPGPANERFPDLAIREGDWKLLINEDGSKPQLYNLAKDAGESKNMASEQPAVVERLKKLVLDWRKALPVDTETAKGSEKGELRKDPG